VYPRLPGTVHANVQIPEPLHQAMKDLRQIRRQMEGADVKLCRLYREAVEQYVYAKPQQRLLAERHPESVDPLEGVEIADVTA
jgi:hypothetical protein